MKHASMASLALLLGLSAIAEAQVGGRVQTSDPKCQAPADQHTSQDGVPSHSADSLTGKLSECEGVLEPPPTGDAEFAQPPPDKGKTPIVKPEDLPQQPKQK